MFVYDKLPLSPRSLCCAFHRSDTAVQRHSYAARALYLSFISLRAGLVIGLGTSPVNLIITSRMWNNVT